MPDFPSGVATPGGSSYTSPLLDFSPVGNLQQTWMQGTQDAMKRESQTAFRNGIPKTATGDNDYKAMTNKMLQIGDYGTAAQIGNLGYQQGSLDQLRTNPELVGYPPAGGGAAGNPAPSRPASAAVPYDSRPARPNNSDGFNPPPAENAGSSQPASLAPNVKAEIDRRGTQGDFETRKRNLGNLMASPFPGVKEYAGKLLDSLLKEQERTPMEKEVDPGRGNAYGVKVNTDVGGKNRELTPEQKNIAPGGGGAPSAAQVAENIKVEGANRTMTPTAKDTMPVAGESPAAAAERIKSHGLLKVKAGEAEIKNFDTEYTGLQKLAQSSFNGIQKAELAKNLTMAPGFYSGPLQPSTLMYQQFKSTFGSNPASAVPQEAFSKVTTDMLTEQIKALGQSGVGRVLLAEVQNMQKGLASLGISPAGNRAQLEIVSRVYKQTQELGQIATEIARQNVPPENKRVMLDQATRNYYAANPIFTEQEKNDPRIISAPAVPPTIKTPEQLSAWARGVGLTSGNLIKIDGQVRAVP